MTGPSLAHVWGSKAGTARGFPRYSDALKKSGIVWNEETLGNWLRSPAGFIPGTGMAFPGIKDARAREDLIAYLRAVSEGKAPKPPASGMGMMMGGSKSNLKEANPKDRVTALRYCGDTYFVTTADGQVHKFWEFNLRFKTDSSADGPAKGKPAIVDAGMRGDRASVIFASPGEISTFIKTSCDR
jgi:cytochrome c